MTRRTRPGVNGSNRKPIVDHGETEPDAGTAQASVAEVERWTRGVRMRTRALSLAILATVIAVPTMLSVAIMNAGAPGTRTATSRTGADVSRTSRASEFATAFVRAWLGPTATDALDRFHPGISSEIPVRPVRVGNVSVADLVLGRGDIITVVVAADVDGSRQYFSVPLAVDAQTIAALGLPSPVAAPRPAAARALDYPHQIQPGGPVADAIEAFLAALLLGRGEITRYVSPGAEIVPIQPSPYQKADPSVIRGSVEEQRRLSDGDRLGVLVTVELTDRAKRRYTATYALEMAARGGRWEVAAVQPAPAVVAASPSVSPTGSIKTK